MSKPNEFEASARAKKVARLVAILHAAGTGSPAARYSKLLTLSDEQWACASLLVGSRPASGTTRHAVLVAFARTAILDRGADIARAKDLGQWDAMACACNELTTGEPGCPALDAYQQIVDDVADETRRSA